MVLIQRLIRLSAMLAFLLTFEVSMSRGYGSTYQKQRGMKMIKPGSNDVSMSSYCGKWQQNYITRHNLIMKRKLRKKRILMYMCHHKVYDCGGLGDQMIGIMSSFLIAILTKRAFVINYPELNYVFNPNAIDWRYKGGIPISNYTYLDFNNIERFHKVNYTYSSQGKAAIYISMMQLDLRNWKRRLKILFRLMNNYNTVILRAHHGIYSHLLTSNAWYDKRLRQKGFTLENTPGCLLHFLLRPKAAITQSVKDIQNGFVSPDIFSVCIHIRPIKKDEVDDSLFTNRRPSARLMNSVDFIFKCAQKVTDKFCRADQKVKWFLMSSSPWLKKKAFEKFPDRIMKTNIKPKHVGLVNSNKKLMLALKDVVKEWYLFSKCNKFVFISSGLSKTSIAYSLNYNSSFMFPHSLFLRTSPSGSVPWEEYCDVDKPTSIYTMASEWSRL